MGEHRKTTGTDREPAERQQRLTVRDAARHLGISESAVRMRVKRGKLTADKEGDRLYILLNTEPTHEPTNRAHEVINELRDRVLYLESHIASREVDLAAEREANRENRRIIAELVKRNSELPAPSALRGPWEEGANEVGRQVARRLVASIVALAVFVPSAVGTLISYFNNADILAVISGSIAFFSFLVGLVGTYSTRAKANTHVPEEVDQANERARRAETARRAL